MTLRGVLFVIFIALITGVLAAVGIWQSRMAVEENERRTWIIEQEGRSPLQIDSPLEAADQYRLAEATGRFESEGTLLIGNRISDGRIGYRVLSVFRVFPGDIVLLVDRGWLEASKIAGDIPVVTVPSGDMSIFGQLIIPAGQPPFFGEDDVVATGNVWRYVDIDDARVWTGMALESLVLKLDAASPAATGFSSGHCVICEDSVARISRYAAQWFLLALLFPMILLATWVEVRVTAPEKP